KIDDLLHLLVGRAAAVVPLLLIAVGGLVFVERLLLDVNLRRLGVILACTSFTLAVASTDTLHPEHHGGLIGAYARSTLQGLIGGIGVSRLAVVGFMAAFGLIRGA